MSKKNKRSIFDDKRFVLLLSVLIAFLSWVVVAGFIQPGEDKDIDEINLQYSEGESAYKNLGLMISSGISEETGTVTVKGNDTVISNLTNGDFMLYLDYRNVTGPGVYELPVKCKIMSSSNFELVDYGIGNDLKKTVTLEFEEVLEKTLEIQVDAPALTAMEGFFRDKPRLDKTEVAISGPSSIVDKVARVAAVIEDEDILRESRQFNAVPLVYFDEDGNVLDMSGIEASVASVNIEIAIYTEGILQLGIDFTGLRSNFDEEWLKSLAVISPQSVHVAGRPEAIEMLPEVYTVATIDISEIVEGVPIEVEDLQNQLTSVKIRDDIESLFISFDLSSLESRTVEVPASGLRVVNAPSGLNVKIVDERVPSVSLMGDSEQIKEIVGENVVLQIDAYNVDSLGRQELQAKVVITKYNRVFSVGTYQIMCEVSADN